MGNFLLNSATGFQLAWHMKPERTRGLLKHMLPEKISERTETWANPNCCRHKGAEVWRTKAYQLQSIHYTTRQSKWEGPNQSIFLMSEGKSPFGLGPRATYFNILFLKVVNQMLVRNAQERGINISCNQYSETCYLNTGTACNHWAQPPIDLFSMNLTNLLQKLYMLVATTPCGKEFSWLIQCDVLPFIHPKCASFNGWLMA